jgi:hypothetical protein
VIVVGRAVDVWRHLLRWWGGRFESGGGEGSVGSSDLLVGDIVE